MNATTTGATDQQKDISYAGTRSVSKGKPPLVHEYLATLINLTGISQREIAEHCKIKSTNVISMIKSGVTRLPMAKIVPMAEVLNVDPFYLFSLCMNEYDPETWATFENIFKGQPILTAAEIEMIETIRESGVPNPKLHTLEQKEKLRKLVASLKPA